MKYIKSSMRDIQNLDEIYEMLIENYKNTEKRFHPSAGDMSYLENFEEDFETFRSKAYQWRDSDNILAGIAWPDYRGTYYISIRQTNDEIFEIILDDIEAENSKGKEIWLWSCETDTARQAVLKQRNYSTNGWYMFYGHKSLADFEPVFNLPEGYTIRELAEGDLPDKTMIMTNDLGDDLSIAIEKYQNMQKSIVYDKRTDLVVVDKSDNIVSYCNGWFDSKNKIGAIEPCRTTENHSGKGLMTNLMSHLFMIYKQNGINDVYIPHGGLCTYEDENDDAMRLYKKIGFKEVYRMYVRIKNYNPAEHDEYENGAHNAFCAL